MDIWTNFKQLLFSAPDCITCKTIKSQKQGFCSGCYHDLPHISHSCLRCGLAVSAERQCACKDEDWPFSICIAACAYAFPVDALISQLKNQHKLSLSEPLGLLIASQIKRQRIELPELLIPVPSSTERLQQRGFNQAAEIAKVVSKKLSIPVDYSSVQHNKQNAVQKNLNKQQRLQNVNAAFTLSKPIRATHVAIIDDVITTGATTKAIAYLLRENGVKTIQSWSIARVL
ncbi:ComF family protein [Moraxellaceae bacterium AER2_44_116]|nr:ComF family protein [Moraxellaceae bacterium]TQC97393.1 ComF family protein [Moraxellaceae bacterium AER2_44_116]